MIAKWRTACKGPVHMGPQILSFAGLDPYTLEDYTENPCKQIIKIKSWDWNPAGKKVRKEPYNKVANLSLSLKSYNS